MAKKNGKSLERGKSIKRVGKTDEELKQIAKDLWAGKIFCDRQVTNPDLIPSVFMPLFFMDKKSITRMQKSKISLLYEYYDKAGPRGINGMPIFTSCHTLTESETKKMFEYYDKFKELANSL